MPPLNISAEHQQFCMKHSEQGLFFQARWNESKEWYAMIKTYKNIIISVGYQWFYTKPSEQGLFFQAGQNESKEWYAMIETYKNRLGWSMDSNPICHPSPAKKIKCSFLDYVQPLMIGQVIRATNGDWNAKKGPLSHHKVKCSFLDYVQLLMIGWAI